MRASRMCRSARAGHGPRVGARVGTHATAWKPTTATSIRRRAVVQGPVRARASRDQGIGITMIVRLEKVAVPAEVLYFAVNVCDPVLTPVTQYVALA